MPATDDETVSVEEPVPPREREKLVGLSDIVSPVGTADAERDTLPVKPLTLPTSTVLVARSPCMKLSEVELGVTVKSGMLTVTATDVE